MHQDQAATLAGLVEVLVDLDAVVAHRGIDRQAGAGQVGKLAAETEAHNADLAGAVRAGAQGRDDVAQVACELGGVELCPQRPCLSAALVGVRKVAGRLLPPEDIRRQGDEPVGGVAVGLPHRSRNVLAICSWSGLRRYCSGVRSWVWMNASAGMPGTSFRSPSWRICLASKAIRTV